MILIVGANGFIGKNLYRALKNNAFEVKGAYFPNMGNLDPSDAIYLNLEDTDFREIDQLAGIETVVLCHGITSLDKCKQQPEQTRLVNVENTIKLLGSLNKEQVRVVYLSTNLVYAGDKAKPNEREKTDPHTEYGCQKVAVEDYIVGNFKHSLILRLTKIFGLQKKDGTIFTAWLDKMLSGQKIRAANDCFISPILIGDLVKQILPLIIKNKEGIYNIGGERIETLAVFAHELARYCNCASKIEEVKISELGLIETRPVFNSVDSSKLWHEIGREITPIKKCFAAIIENYGVKENK